MSFKSYEPNGITWTNLRDDLWFRLGENGVLYLRAKNHTYALLPQEKPAHPNVQPNEKRKK